MGTTRQVELLYDFMISHARSQTPFSMSDMATATGWQGDTSRTYLSKQVKSLIRRGARRGQFHVKGNMIYLTKDEFVVRVSQKENILPSYRRVSYEHVVTYEFLMPLTREDTLRGKLDQLFYRDTLEHQIDLIGVEKFDRAVRKAATESDNDCGSCGEDRSWPLHGILH